MAFIQYGLIFLSFLFHFSLQAADFYSPRTAALGGASHASPAYNDAIYLNPAYLSFSKVYGIGGYFQFDPSGSHLFNISIADGTKGPIFHAGIGYTYGKNNQLIHLGVSKDFFEKLGLGIGGKIIWSNIAPSGKSIEAYFSIFHQVSSWLQISILVDNLFSHCAKWGLYREITLGTQLNLNSICFIFFDPLWVFNEPQEKKLGYQLGLEIPFLDSLFLRVGKFQNARMIEQRYRGEGYGIGVGWQAPKISLDYGISFSALSSRKVMTHYFGLNVYF